MGTCHSFVNFVNSVGIEAHNYVSLQKHALYEEPASVYLDLSLEQLRISDANALLLEDQKSRRNKKHRQYNMPAQEPSMARLQRSIPSGVVPADPPVGMLPSHCARALPEQKSKMPPGLLEAFQSAHLANECICRVRTMQHSPPLRPRTMRHPHQALRLPQTPRLMMSECGQHNLLRSPSSRQFKVHVWVRMMVLQGRGR